LSAKKKDKNRSENSQPEITIVQRRIIFDQDFREDLQWWYRQDIQNDNRVLWLSQPGELPTYDRHFLVL
jgi:hypothetical protein